MAVSIGLSLIPMAAPKLFAATAPAWAGPILHSGITLGAIGAIVLNLLLNSDRLGEGVEPHPADREPAFPHAALDRA